MLINFFIKNESSRLRSELQTNLQSPYFRLAWGLKHRLFKICYFITNLTSDDILGKTSPVSVSNVGNVAKFEFKSSNVSKVFVIEPLHKPLQGSGYLAGGCWLANRALLLHRFQ